MRILLVSYDFSPGGAERFVVDLSNELVKIHEIHFLAVLDDRINGRNFYKNDLSRDINYHCARENLGFSLHKIFKLCKIVRKISPDIVHLNGAVLVHYFLLTILLFRKPKYLETLHSSAYARFAPGSLPFLSKLIYKLNLVKLVTISGENKKSLENHCDIKNSILIYNGRSTPKASSHIDDVKKEILAKKNSESDKVFIHVGRCSPEKNQKLLISVFNKLAENGYGFILLIIGPDFDSPEGKNLRNCANSRHIFFLGPKTNVTDYFLCSDGFFLTSLNEGLPITLIESFACGCIPVSTPVSGAVDLIIDGETGFIAENFSEVSYLHTVNRFIKTCDEIQKVKLIELFNKSLTIEQCANNYSSLYYKLIQKKTPENQLNI